MKERSIAIEKKVNQLAVGRKEENLNWFDPEMNQNFPMACIGNIVTEYKGKKERGDNTAFLIS